MQIIGRRNADFDVLAVSAAFERLRPWQDNYEICRKRSLLVCGQGRSGEPRTHAA
jgi:amidase/aspartyl-tRNA(Asn)/glutamyl-tRNA(Gln) amidotransferase subunit A